MDINAAVHIRLLAAELGVEQSAPLGTCPFCNVLHEKKFSVKRIDTGLLYNCFRGSCRASGFIPDGVRPGVEHNYIPPKRRPWLGPLQPLSLSDEKFFYDAWGLENLASIKKTEDNRYAFPLRGSAGERRGWIIRMPYWKGVPDSPLVYTGDSQTKALTYKDDPSYSTISFAPQDNRYDGHSNGYPGNHIVLVEDYLSALKVSQACSRSSNLGQTKGTGVALNGTHLDYTGVAEILESKPLMVTIALDPGAESQAYRLLEKWGLSFNACQVLHLRDDPKAIPEDELRSILDVRW